MPLDSQGSYHRVRAHPHNAPIHHHSSHSPALTRTQPQENSIGPSTSSPAGHRPADGATAWRPQPTRNRGRGRPDPRPRPTPPVPPSSTPTKDMGKAATTGMQTPDHTRTQGGLAQGLDVTSTAFTRQSEHLPHLFATNRCR